MRILVACEYSGTVREAFRDRGFDAWSCDILPTEIPSEFHYQCDVLDILDRDWNLMVAFPPCTHLAVSGARHFHKKQKEQQGALDFVTTLLNAPIKHIALENPVGVISTRIRKPDQIIQPYQFGHEAQKTTCIWLKNLPKLTPTKVVGRGEFVTFPSGKRHPKWWSDLSSTGRPKNALLRGKTFQGIADAMAEQWGNYLKETQ